MHSALYRLNALVTLSVTVLAVLCAVVSFTDSLHEAQPEVDVKVTKIERFWRLPGGPMAGNDEALLVLDVRANLTDLFTWNTKQVFLFICAEFATPRNSLNQVSLWDLIIEDKANAAVHLPFTRSKYGLIDQGNNLRGLEYNLTLYWNVMPNTGMLRTHKKVFPDFTLPADYMKFRPGSRRAPSSRQQWGEVE
eukprot:TRINITY_DN4477_c0_g1_i1.p1 TRINITY_DN4477_c0_g1~~TRINITY_DN4477_c0_g1_i1.p1  ORF type:complete len:193 (+),score=42.95 TRINITY_DN4477_c0_g1_i1:130-708(+)